MFLWGNTTLRLHDFKKNSRRFDFIQAVPKENSQILAFHPGCDDRWLMVQTMSLEMTPGVSQRDYPRVFIQQPDYYNVCCHSDRQRLLKLASIGAMSRHYADRDGRAQ
jgi:hypothetical protein